MRLSALTILFCLLLAPLSVRADYLHSLPDRSHVLEGYADSVQTRLSALPLCPAEGVWQMAGDGALFAIERSCPSPSLAPDEMRMVILRSPCRRVRPGTVLGHVVPTARPGVYQARLYTSFARRTGLNIPRSFTLEVKNDLLTFIPRRMPVKVNLLRLLPYMFRRVFTLQSSGAPENLNGAVRIFPARASHPLSPVYL